MSTGESSKKTTSSVHDVNADKPPFGSRFLTEDADVWSKNAWDHVPAPDDQGDIIAASLAKQRGAPVPEEDKQKYNATPARHWDNFYKANASSFFKNRKWLHNEFPELVAAAQPDSGPMAIVEIGCGAGNAVFPLLSANQNPSLKLHAFDYSSHAVKLVQNNELYLNPPVGTINAAVWDLSSPSEDPESMGAVPPGIEPGTVDIVVLVFMFSALHPNEWGRAVANIRKMLKPGGLAVFRDYGRHDLTQLRFKGGRLLEDNFYIRGDKTRVYFFELDELALLFTGARVAPGQATTQTTVETDEADEEAVASGAALESLSLEEPEPTTQTSQTPMPEPTIHPLLLDDEPLAVFPLPHPLFAIEQLGVDRRLLINRKRQLKMYRVWMQGKFRKL